NAIPDAIAQTSSAGVAAACGPLAERLTRPIASTAQQAPTNAGVDGSPSSATPATSGTSAAVTAVVGATTVIAPRDSPRYSSTKPVKPVTPATPPQARSAGC